MKKTTQIQIDENQRNCIVSGLMFLQMEMNKQIAERILENTEQDAWLTQQIEMMSDMIDELEQKFK